MTDMSKAQQVRDYLAKHPKATSKEIAKALSASGTEIHEGYISTVRARTVPKKSKRTKAHETGGEKREKKPENDATTRRTRSPRPYPARTLEEALAIPQAIREQNNGNPWDTEMVAQASLSVKRNNNKFFYTAAAARDYGLTIGTRDTEKIELAPLGRDLFLCRR